MRGDLPLGTAAQTENGRGLPVEKFVAAYADEPLEFGRRGQAEARRRGLGKVACAYVVADRFAQATGGLDLYHASQHLWTVAHTLHPEAEAVARAWVEPGRHRLMALEITRRSHDRVEVWQLN